MSYLAASPHVSKRGVEEIVETVFGIPISLGTVANLEQEMSAALVAAHAQAQEAVQQAPVKNVDETGWKQRGQKRWLWAAATTQGKRSANCVSRRESVLTGRAFGMLNGPGEQCAPQGRFCESDRGPLFTVG